MRFDDVNKSWTAPEGYDLVKVYPAFGFLCVEYLLREPNPARFDTVTLFLNNQGKEVGRHWTNVAQPSVAELPHVKAEFSRKYRFKNGLDLILLGLEEILKCLSVR